MKKRILNEEIRQWTLIINVKTRTVIFSNLKLEIEAVGLKSG